MRDSQRDASLPVKGQQTIHESFALPDEPAPYRGLERFERIENRRLLGCAAMAFSDFEMNSITGDPVSFAQYDGHVSLVVNVASR